ncbi:MAG: hypothetical protein VXX36_05605 [Verrucomicrobiota bacterium]|nr:hypothetical protein [Verrucomicrobiota bacterium]
MPEKRDQLMLLCLQLGAFFCFTGWAWVHFYWEAPYGAILWQDDTYSLLGRFGISWEEFVGTGAGDGWVQKWSGRIGWLYLACAILTLTARKKSRIQMAGLLGGSVLLIILSYAKFLKAQGQLPMFVEHGGQMLIPVLLVLALVLGVRHRATVIATIAAFIATFAGHGCYAVGLWPTPSTFYAMTTVILNFDFQATKIFLLVAGILDFIICIGLFIPVLRCASAIYGFAWGLLTALARPVAGMSLSLNYWGADQFLHEAVLRAPHFLIPLYLFLLWKKPASAPAAEANPDSPEAAIMS